MSDPTANDLKTAPSAYQSSRSLWDALVGGDPARPLVEAVKANDSLLQDLLRQPQSAGSLLEKPHVIYQETRPSNGQGDLRQVMAMPMLNIQRLVTSAVYAGQVGALRTLLTFTSEQQGVDFPDVINRFAIGQAIRNGDADVMEALVPAYPQLLSREVGRDGLPLSYAVTRGKTDVVAVLLKNGAKPQTTGGYTTSLLSLSTRSSEPRMAELLLRHGAEIANSGALHHAADHGRNTGALDIMRVLIQHGANVNELLPEARIPRSLQPSLRATWTPMHFAAAAGQ